LHGYPGIRSTGSLAFPFGSLPLEWGDEFDGISTTGRQAAPGFPAADLLESRCPFPAIGQESLLMTAGASIQAMILNARLHCR